MTPTVSVVCLPAAQGSTTGTRALERGRVEAVLLGATGATSIGRVCARCASTEHGQAWVRGTAHPTYVSIAYTEGATVAAWSICGPVGIDVERDDGRDAGAYGDLSTWTRAEAILKATGAGLHRDPTDLPDVWNAPLPGLPAGYIGCVALLGARGAEVSVRQVG